MPPSGTSTRPCALALVCVRVSVRACVLPHVVYGISISTLYHTGMPQGPHQLADFVGLDTCQAILSGWIKKYPEEKIFIMPKSLEAKVCGTFLSEFPCYSFDVSRQGICILRYTSGPHEQSYVWFLNCTLLCLQTHSGEGGQAWQEVWPGLLQVGERQARRPVN